MCRSSFPRSIPTLRRNQICRSFMNNPNPWTSVIIRLSCSWMEMKMMLQSSHSQYHLHWIWIRHLCFDSTFKIQEDTYLKWNSCQWPRTMFWHHNHIVSSRHRHNISAKPSGSHVSLLLLPWLYTNPQTQPNLSFLYEQSQSMDQCHHSIELALDGNENDATVIPFSVSLALDLDW